MQSGKKQRTLGWANPRL